MSRPKLVVSTAAALGLLCLSGGMAVWSFPLIVQEVTSDSVTYEEFLSYKRGERVRIFNQVSAENRCELAKTHFQRYLEQNRSRLTEVQIQLIEETLNLLVPQIYETTAERMEAIRNSDDPEREFFSEQERKKKLEELGDKALRLFSRRENVFRGVASW